MNNQHFHPQYYRQSARSIHTSFIETLKDLRAVTDGVARQLLIDHLQDQHDVAVALIKDNTSNLDAQSLGMLQHLTTRTVDEHLSLSGGTELNLVTTH
tara:strand:- start:95 stop:388 length:294 start_codon:yes stop_codon:yes gene_type:complete